MWRSCGHLCVCARCFHRTKNCVAKLTPWKSATTPDFKRFLKRSGRCWRLQFLIKKRSDFTPGSKRGPGPLNRAILNVNNRKHISYRLFTQILALRKEAFSAILFLLSIRGKFLQIDTSTKVFGPRKVCSAPGASGPDNLEKRTCGIRRWGIVFAASRSAGRDGAGTLRAAALLAVLAVKE